MVDIFDTDLAGNTLDGTAGALAATTDAPVVPEAGGSGTQEVVSNNPGARIFYVCPLGRGIQQSIRGENRRPTLWPLQRRSPFDSRFDLLRDYVPEETTVVTITATASDDVDSTGASGGWISHAIGLQSPVLFRAWMRWSAAQIASLTSTLPIASVTLIVNAPYVLPGSVKTVSGGPYGGTIVPHGQTDPSSETGENRFAHCDISANAYFTESSEFLAEGPIEIDLGAGAIEDINDARIAGAPFAIALRQTDESSVTSDWSSIDGFTQALPPQLRVTFTNVSAPTITDAGDEDFAPDETPITVTGTGFGASQGTGRVELNTASDGSGISVTQTIVSWSATSIAITITQGGHNYGALYLIVHNDDGQRSTGYAVTLSAPVAAGAAGWWAITSANGILDASPADDYLNDVNMAALTGGYRIGVGDVRLPIRVTFTVIRSVTVSFLSTGNNWTYRVVDRDTGTGPRIQTYDAGVLADAVIDAHVNGLK